MDHRLQCHRWGSVSGGEARPDRESREEIALLAYRYFDRIAHSNAYVHKKESNRRPADLVLELLDVVAETLELVGLFRLDDAGPLLLESSNLRFELALVEPHHVMVGPGVDAEGRAEAEQDLLLVHLGVALHRLVLDARGDLAELGDGLLAQLFIGICHGG